MTLASVNTTQLFHLTCTQIATHLHTKTSHTHTYTHACEHTYTGIPLRLHRGKSTSFKDSWKIKWKLCRWRRGERKQRSPTLLSYFLLSLPLFLYFTLFNILPPHTLLFLPYCLLSSFPFHINLWKLYFIFLFFSVSPSSFYKLSPCISLHLAFL